MATGKGKIEMAIAKSVGRKCWFEKNNYVVVHENACLFDHVEKIIYSDQKLYMSRACRTIDFLSPAFYMQLMAIKLLY